ncbi:MAG: ATP-binding cassette domain-containing protein [Lacibacter sp.]
MKILLSDAGKRYNREWIFRHVHYTFESGTAYAITGPNGSGKSTLLQVLAGATQHSEGAIVQQHEGRELPADSWYRYCGLVAPYLELPEEMTLTEFLDFHFGFKPALPGITSQSAIAAIGLQHAAHRQLRYYSSGMKQRVKLAQALFCNVPLLLLDEPCTNLDAAGIDLYHQLIATHATGRLILVSSNDEREYRFCTQQLNMQHYK